jgi:hypothetical protein
VGPPSPSGLRGAWGQAAAAAPLGSVSWAAPGRAAAAAGERELRVVQGRARASAAAWAPLPALSGHQPREPPGLLAAEPEGPPGSPAPPPSALFFLAFAGGRHPWCSPLWQRSPHPPSGWRRPARKKRGPRRRAMLPPRAPRSRRVAGCVSSTAACPCRIRWPGTCTGRTKWVSEGARGSPPPRAPGRIPPRPDPAVGTPHPSLFRSLPEPGHPGKRGGSESGATYRVWGVRLACLVSPGRVSVDWRRR